MRYKIGDKVILINGNIMTIDQINYTSKWYRMLEDPWYCYIDEMIKRKVGEEMPLDKAGQITDFEYDGLAYTLPEGYQFVDENGNVIEATKIVLEKKKKEVILTQEQIDTMVHESCVLFCKHCGCGVPRETCTSLGSCKDHDEYRESMRTYFEKHKK